MPLITAEHAENGTKALLWPGGKVLEEASPTTFL